MLFCQMITFCFIDDSVFRRLPCGRLEVDASSSVSPSNPSIGSTCQTLTAASQDPDRTFPQINSHIRPHRTYHAIMVIQCIDALLMAAQLHNRLCFISLHGAFPHANRLVLRSRQAHHRGCQGWLLATEQPSNHLDRGGMTAQRMRALGRCVPNSGDMIVTTGEEATIIIIRFNRPAKVRTHLQR